MLPVVAGAQLAAGSWPSYLPLTTFLVQNLAKCFAINFRAVSVINLPLRQATFGAVNGLHGTHLLYKECCSL